MPEKSPVAAAEFDAFIAEHPGITIVDAVFIDLNGSLRGKRVPVSDARKLYTGGMQMPGDIFMLDARGEMTNPLGLGSDDGDPDGTSFPVPGTLVTVGKPPHRRAQVLMTLNGPNGKPLEVEPRNVLIDALAQFSGTGLTPVVAVELEFFLIDPQRTPAGSVQPPICPTTGVREKAISVYGINDLDRYDAFLTAVAEECARQRLPATTAVAEYAPGQFEINLNHVPDPVAAADHAALLRPLIKHVAREQGMEATFMAKPYSGTAGSGMHVHISLMKGERNVFAGHPGLSDTLRHAVGGLAATMHESMAIFAPNANAFRRFTPNLFVPVNRRWGINNRSTGLRIPAGEEAATRIEHRVAGADANPYLVLAAILIGIRHGLDNRIDPGAPHVGDASDFLDPTVPFEIMWALEELQNSKVMRGALSGYVDVYAEAKRTEYKRFHATIPAHEHDWYL
ncbi:MAG: glutamine synthetase [Alphaproteobacteria bacterium]|nr:glutamine synthetase [Alphaproteobacteria bacterium]